MLIKQYLQYEKRYFYMDIIKLDLDNIATEHICCALDSKTSNIGVSAKKQWLSDRIKEGLIFKKQNSRGKVFIEYIPAEYSWMPVIANNYLLINCHWVSGSYKNQGCGRKLLEECEADAKRLNKIGIVLVSSSKKKPFLSDKGFYLKYGFEVVDTAPPYFELLAKTFDKKAIKPHFNNSVKTDLSKELKGIDIFYTKQCPFTIPYVDMLKPVILESSVPIRTHEITSREEAQNHICPITTYSVFIDGKFHTQEILTPAKLKKIAENIKG